MLYNNYHSAPVTIFVIKKLLYLVHDGCLWLGEPIPIMNHLIHRNTQLACKGEDPTNISEGKSDDLAIAEAMKKKFKLEMKKIGYAISSINNAVIKFATQILARKVVRKCHADEVPTQVVHLPHNAQKGSSLTMRITCVGSCWKTVARHRSRGRLSTMHGFYYP